MSTNDDGGSAFPWGEHGAHLGGMTLRDYFAAKAITGTCPGSLIPDDEVAKYARWAYRMADMMIAERAK